jgi:pimeloyl-ACP methyl ester carboxylesterase
MGTITTTDGTEIFYKDWGSGQPIVFSHGWPLSADDWDTQMLFFLQHGYRVIAHDRRGHGRSTQTSDGHDMDHYADDLAALTADLDLEDAVHVGHSTGGGEVVHYIARHGESRVAKAVLIDAVPLRSGIGPRRPGRIARNRLLDILYFRLWCKVFLVIELIYVSERFDGKRSSDRGKARAPITSARSRHHGRQATRGPAPARKTPQRPRAVPRPGL